MLDTTLLHIFNFFPLFLSFFSLIIELIFKTNIKFILIVSGTKTGTKIQNLRLKTMPCELASLSKDRKKRKRKYARFDIVIG